MAVEAPEGDTHAMDRIAWIFPAIGHSANAADENYGHPAHRGFQRSVDADPILFPNCPTGPVTGTFLEPLLESWKLSVPEYDVFVLENAEVAYATPFIRRAHPDATIVLVAAHRVFGLESYDFASDPFAKGVVRRAERYLDTKLIQALVRRHVDGIVAVSDYVADHVAGFAPDTPIRTVEPYVQPEFGTELDDLDPSLDANHAVTISEARDHKGVDLLVDAWEAVRRRAPTATLHVVGTGHPSEYGDVPGVSVTGYVDDLVAEFEAASLYVHPARVDAFGVTVTEAMRAGTVPLVTRTTGSSSLVASLDEELVVDPTPASIADGVVKYFQTSEDYREKLSRAARDEARAYNAERQQAEFFDQFHAVLKRARPHAAVQSGS